MPAVLNPFAEEHILPGKSTVPLLARFINTHTMVWNMRSCQDYFAQRGNPYSHYGTEGSGEARQWQDLRFRAASDLEGNPWSISYENADRGDYFPSWTGSNVPPFTDAQADKLIKMQAWDCIRFNIPPLIVPDSIPVPNGLSWHRKGIDPWRVAGGLRYSRAYGKVCPGDQRIEQYREEIVPGIQALVLGETLGGVMTDEQYNNIVDMVRKEISYAVHHIITGKTNGRYSPDRPIEGQDFSWVGAEDSYTLDKVRSHAAISAENAVRSGVAWLSTGKPNIQFSGKPASESRNGLDYAWMNDAVDLTELQTP